MSFSIQKYDPSKVTITVGTNIMRGFGESAMVEVEYSEDHYSMHIGVDGNGRHVKILNTSGTVTVTLADYSPSNRALSVMRDLDIAMPITLTDKTTKDDSFFAQSCMLVKTPNMVKAKEAGEYTWVFQFIKGKVFLTGGTPDLAGFVGEQFV